jgi:hypothetical protein
VLTDLAIVCFFLQQELMRKQISKKHAGGVSLLVVFLVWFVWHLGWLYLQVNIQVTEIIV